MASANLPPRQKMINMMYLVLTAILALNVSKEVLDSFAVLDADLVRSERSLEERSRAEYTLLAEAARRFPERFGGPNNTALAIRAEADSLVAHITRVKASVIMKADDRQVEEVIGRGADGRDSTIALAMVGMKDDRDVLTNLLVGSEPARPRIDPGSANDIKRRVHAYRDRLKVLCGSADTAFAGALDRLFELPDGKDASGVSTNWEALNFHDVPLVAGIAVLSKLQVDVRSAENDMLKWLHRSATRGDHVMSSVAPAVIPQSSLVMLGDSFRAEVFLAAYDSKNGPVILRSTAAGNVPLPLGDDGKGRLRLPADQVGERSVKGVIQLQGPNGPEEHPYEVAYQVMAPLFVVSPTKMNVLYRGVDNPLELSVPGVPNEQVRTVIDNGTVARTTAGWVARVNTLGKAKLNAQVTMPNGTVRTIGPVEFRVKDLPAPQAYVGGAGPTEARIRKTALTAAQGVVCRLGTETEFNEPFRGTRFSISVTKAGNTVPHAVVGNAFDNKAKQILGSLRAGDRISFEDIRARLANGQGREYELAQLSFLIVP